MVAFMRAAYTQKHRMGGVVMLLGGLVLLGIAFLVAFLMKKAGTGFVLVLKGLGAVGIFLALYGLFKVITGHTGIDESALAELWLQNESAP